MPPSHRRLMTIEQVSIKKTLKNRQALQMAVLTIHDNQKKDKQQQKKNIQTEIFYFNRNQKHLLLKKNSQSKINVLETINSRKSLETNKNTELHIPSKSQSSNINEIHRVCREISRQKSQRYHRGQSLVPRLNHKLQKVHIRANINLLLKNKQINQTQRILTKEDAIKHESLHQSLSCRQILVQDKNLFSNLKIKKKLKNNLFRAKITTRSNWREKLLSRSLENNQGEQTTQDQFSGWQTKRRFQQPLDLEDAKNQLFLS